jgi:hypothetical protein
MVGRPFLISNHWCQGGNTRVVNVIVYEDVISQLETIFCVPNFLTSVYIDFQYVRNW